jgi:hypothetical protein
MPKYSLFWDFTQRKWVVSYRRFGTIYRSHLEGSSSPRRMQHAKRMRRVILLSVACLSLPFFPYYLKNGTIFGKKVTEHKMCVLIFSTTSV